MDIMFLDLFSGAGGLSEGFIQEGYSPVAHVESDKAACFTLKTRAVYHWLKVNKKLDIYEQYLHGRMSRDALYSNVPSHVIDSVLNKKIEYSSLPLIFKLIDDKLQGKKLDLIIGGPPCQAYSLIGRARDKNHMIGDERNYLYTFYAEFLNRYKPKLFVFENVTGLLSAEDTDGKLYFDKMKELFQEKGYTTEYKTLDASDYSVPQARKRVILIGKRGKKSGFYPTLIKSKEKVFPRDVFCDLPKLNAGGGTHLAQPLPQLPPDAYLYTSEIRTSQSSSVTWHQTRPNREKDLEIYRTAVTLWNDKEQRLNYNDLPNALKTHKNRKSFTDRFKVVANHLPSHTVVAHLSKDGHHYIHPDLKQNRSLTVREAARLQTFPDSFYFESVSGKPSRTAAYKQIGNAVPVLLANKIAKALKIQF